MMSALKPPSLLQRFRKVIVDCDCSYFLAKAFGDCSSLGLASASLRMESPRMRRDVPHHQILMEKVKQVKRQRIKTEQTSLGALASSFQGTIDKKGHCTPYGERAD